MRKKINDPSFKTSLIIGGSLLLSLFLAFSWGGSVIRNAATERQIAAFKKDIENIEHENRQLEKEYLYLQSPQYRDKWAKEHEGLMQPGEKVLYIEFAPSQIDENGEKEKELLEREILLERPRRDQWIWLFFGEKEKKTP